MTELEALVSIAESLHTLVLVLTINMVLTAGIFLMMPNDKKR